MVFFQGNKRGSANVYFNDVLRNKVGQTDGHTDDNTIQQQFFHLLLLRFVFVFVCLRFVFVFVCLRFSPSAASFRLEGTIGFRVRGRVNS
jgi:hypothetical protein